MTIKWLGLLSVIAIIAFTAGRYLAPKTEKVIDNSWMDAKATYSQVVNTEKVIVKNVCIVTKKKVSGEIVTKRTENTLTGIDIRAQDNLVAEKKEIVVHEKTVTSHPNFMLNLKADENKTLGIEGHVRIIGPIWLGAEIDTKGKKSVSAGFEF